MSVASQVEAWAESVLLRFGIPDVLILNAGVTSQPDPLWQQQPAAVERVISVNVTGVHYCLRYLLPPMVEQRRGIVIFISSDWGRSGPPLVGPYVASKWALEGMMRSLAQELPQGMAAVSLDPGTVNTDMLRFTFGPGAEEFPSPSQWQGPAADFILNLGSQHNGQSLTLTGG